MCREIGIHKGHSLYLFECAPTIDIGGSSPPTKIMTTEKMNVHKALSELKVLSNRIVNALANDFVVANKHSNDKINGISIVNFNNDMKSHYQQVNDLIERRNALKRAVVSSNAVTKVTVGGTEYTVAEAIEMKNHGMEFYKMLRDELARQYTKAQTAIMVNSGKNLEERAEKYIVSILSSKNDAKIDTKLIDELRAKYIENNTYDMLDPNNVKSGIEALNEMIENFESDIDSALSVSNAITIIEFEY